MATFPQLEYPRTWPPGTEVVGPLLWEPPFEGEAEPPPGDGPLVLVAPSTSQDPEHRLLRSAVLGLADMPVRVLATTNRRPLPEPLAVPANARVVDWLSYARTMPRCDVVVCHGGHGTVARALASGCVVVVVPAAGDMAENAARVDWARVGIRRAAADVHAAGDRAGGRPRAREAGAAAPRAGGVRLGREPRCAGARRRAGGAVRARLRREMRGSRGPDPAAPGTSLGR